MERRRAGDTVGGLTAAKGSPVNSFTADKQARFEVNASKQIVASYGTINDPGFSPTTAVRMNAPYGA